MKDVRSGEHAVIAGIAVKWVVEEDGTREALVLRQKAKLIASDLLVDECANTFWKKVQRRELLKAEALARDALHFDDAVLRTDDGMTTRCTGRQVDEISEDSIAEGVMSNLAQALMLVRGHSDDVNDQSFFRLSAHYAV